MALLNPDMATPEGVRTGLTGGMIAAAAMTLRGLINLALIATMPVPADYGAQDVLLVRTTMLVLIGMETLLAIAAGLRFRSRKGLRTGFILLGLFLLELVAKVSEGGYRPGWTLAYALMALGLFNGIRAARMARQ